MTRPQPPRSSAMTWKPYAPAAGAQTRLRPCLRCCLLMARCLWAEQERLGLAPHLHPVALFGKEPDTVHGLLHRLVQQTIRQGTELSRGT